MITKRMRSARPRRRRTRLALVEKLEPRMMLAADWQNPVDPLDVDGDGTFTRNDLLLVINDLYRNGARAVPNLSGATAPPPFLDVNGDNFISAIDALLAINQWNQNQALSNLTAPLAGSDELLSSTASSATTIDRSELLNVDDQTDVQFSGIFTNRRSGQSTTNVRVTNSSATAIPTPLILVIESISDPTVTLGSGDPKGVFGCTRALEYTYSGGSIDTIGEGAPSLSHSSGTQKWAITFEW